MITPEQTTFHRLQSDSPAAVSVFLSLDGTLADGSPLSGPWHQYAVPLTADEQAIAAAIIARARVMFAAELNTPIIQPSV
jgi:hypothetical protein